MKKKEAIFIASILVIAGILGLGFRISGQRSHNTIRITVDGKEFGTYSLSKDQVIHIGDTNVCEIKDGKVSMIEATSPDHYCMKQKAVDEHGGSIICLPNKVVIEVILSYPKEAFGNSRALRVFISTNVGLSTQEILDTYTRRWPIELFFRQSKGKLALDKYQIRSRMGIQRYWLIMSLAHYMCCMHSGKYCTFEEG